MHKSVFLVTLLSLELAGCGGQPNASDQAAHQDAPASSPTAGQDSAATKTAPDLVTLSAAEQQAAGLRTGRVQPHSIGAELAVNGLLDVPPENAVSITAPLGGYIERTSLLQGTRVRSGQVLAVLRNPEFVNLQKQYLELRSQLKFAQAELARQRELYQQEVAPLKNYQRAQAEAEALRVQVEAQTAQLHIAGLPVGGRIVTTATLRAPRAGFVRAVNVTVGQSVTATEPLFELVDPEHLHVELTVFEKDVAQVQKGQLIRFALASDSAGTARVRTARVYLVGRAVSQDRTVRVHGHLDQEDDPALLPGLYVRATIETGRRTAPTLPDAALVRFEGNYYAFAVQAPGRYRMVPVATGRSEEGNTEVRLPAGVPASTTFITTGAYSLLGKLKNTAEEE